MKFFLITSALVAVLALASGKVTYDGYKFVTVEQNTLEEVAALVKLQDTALVETAHDIGGVGRPATLMFPPGHEGTKLKQVLDGANLKYEVVDLDVGELVRKERETIEKRAIEWETLRQGDDRPVQFDINTFHTHEEINQYLRDIAAAYPTIASTEVIGTSLEGREMVILKVCTQGPCGAVNKIVWIESTIHAREWIATSSQLWLIDNFVQTRDPSDDERVLGVDWYFLPVVNPDGYAYTWSDERNWRKTRNVIPGNECIGVDANRNYDYEWSLVGASFDSCSQTYHGPDAFSEVEIVQQTSYIAAEKAAGRDIVYLESTHSFGNYIMYPWGYSCSAPDPDAEDHETMAQAGYDNIREVENSRYAVGPICNTIYPASGSTVDYVYAVNEIKYAFTLEMQQGENHPIDGFLVDPIDIPPNGNEFIAFHRAVADIVIEEY